MHCDTTDHDLLNRVRRSTDEAAWSQFVESYRKPIIDHCRGYGLTPDQAEEVAQDCFIRCFRYLPTFKYSEAVGRFRSWLNLMVNQQIGECFRSRVRDETIKRRYAEMLLELAEPGQGTSREPTGHDFELLAMAFQRVKASVWPQHWQLFEAFVVHGMSASEVARQIGVTSVMVRVTAFRVRNRLKEEWRGLQNGPF
jgi:RNA polymerase sigma-70 factor (ECF subfamily)